jgi:S-adenosylmethionine decarboxylase
LNALGEHLLLELKDCNKEVLNGVSGVVVIAESHICFHSWPEYGYAAIDIFTCGDSVRPEVAAKLLISKLEAKNPTIIELKRGVYSP